ncbi:LysR substrate-binding domain-containing protein [Caulobacter segnis]
MCSVVSSNAPDSIAALMTGATDLLVCHQSSQAPIALPADLYDRAVIGRRNDRALCRSGPDARRRAGPARPSGRADAAADVQQKSSFAHVVDAIIEGGPQKLVGRVALKAETSSVLRAMAVAGHGVAWLPECVAAETAPGALERLDEGEWSASLDIVACRARSVGFPALDRLWTFLANRRD